MTILIKPTHTITPEVAFTSNTHVMNGAHILYVTSNQQEYINNAVSFIVAGIELGHATIFIDSLETVSLVKKALLKKGVDQQILDSVIFGDSEKNYHSTVELDVDRVVQTFSSFLRPIATSGTPIRNWGKPAWLENQCCLKEKFLDYELTVEDFVNEVHSVSVCAYDGNSISADLLLEMSKHHSYIMTDTEFTTSSFYDCERVSPSIGMEENYKETITNLQTMNNQYIHLIEQMPEAAFILLEGTIAYSNMAAHELLESENEPLIGKAIGDFFHPSLSEEEIKRKINLLHQKPSTPVEETFQSLHGKTIEVETFTFPFVFENCKESTMLLVRDIKDRKENQRLVVEAEKLGITGQLAASIAHEIRNPLTSIKGFMALAREGELKLDFISIIDKEIERIETIASELLVLGKPTSMKTVESNATTLLQNSFTLMQSQANMEGVLLEFLSTEEFLPIQCNEEQIKQVFINLIKNAIEATSNNGQILLKIYKQNNKACIEITDNGKGIPEQIQDKLGQPFYSTKENGTGLGLMICYNIIHQHGGTINFKSKENKGTTFNVQLPLIEQ
ncbi:ATP-binding protein [Halalkalibacter akibai]|uniref:histidine kinase n=1 Tax=Halalkalibacter akibai (strain ATCC 43226 / DSM 21942 / CIP 109018 / JCM 9157 / 1139) TaxID=1236973 RepID=W4QPM6_HALA3|nr:ATP-binding protein [Halalkalibacter akibai]GAE34016.1 hypothetical protein JCM9157_1046 [Halalkalibacter akibai JCM 9157]